MSKCVGMLEARQNEAGVTRWHWTVTNAKGEQETSFAYTEALGLRDLESALRDCERKARRFRGGVPHPSSSGPRRGFAGWSRLNPSIDWSSVEDRAAGMSDSALFYALEDIRKTMPIARANDRIDGGDREGWYADEASIYRQELNRRRSR